jgi:hypothetical protein
MEFLIKNFLISRIVRLDNFNIIAHLINTCNGALVEFAIAIGLYFPFGVGDIRFGNNDTQFASTAILIGDKLSLFKILFHLECPFIDYSSKPLKNPAEIR